VSPLYEWSAPRRLTGLRGVICAWGGWLACATLVAMLGSQAGSSLARRAGAPARMAFERVQARAAQLHARRAPALPLVNGLRAQGSAAPDGLSDLALRVAAQAEASGLHVRAFEPIPSGGAQKGTSLATQAFKMSAAGRFSAVRRWLARLPELPALLAPASLEIRPGAEDSVALDAIVHLHADLPGDALRDVAARVAAPGRAAHDVDASDRFDVLDVAFQPRSLAGLAAATASEWQLSGLVADTAHRLALFERGTQSVVVAPGQMRDDLRVIRLGVAGARIEQGGAAPRRIALRGASNQ
jgi:hypothetical protein